MTCADSLKTSFPMKSLRVVKSRNQVSRPVAKHGLCCDRPAFTPLPEDWDDWDSDDKAPEDDDGNDDEMEYTCKCLQCKKRALQKDFAIEQFQDGW